MKGHAELPHRFQKSRSVCHLGIRLLFSLSNVVIESTLVRIPYFFSQRKKRKKKKEIALMLRIPIVVLKLVFGRSCYWKGAKLHEATTPSETFLVSFLSGIF